MHHDCFGKVDCVFSQEVINYEEEFHCFWLYMEQMPQDVSVHNIQATIENYLALDLSWLEPNINSLTFCVDIDNVPVIMISA